MTVLHASGMLLLVATVLITLAALSRISGRASQGDSVTCGQAARPARKRRQSAEMSFGATGRAAGLTDLLRYRAAAHSGSAGASSTRRMP